ncbi:hypothetical protein E3W21_09045 [Pseudomonas sp. F01002]|nr:hypothetical protein E3W21_09045 [Pseudomonas sp. F01002]
MRTWGTCSRTARRRPACVIASTRCAWTWYRARNASPVGAAEGCDLLILIFSDREKSQDQKIAAFGSSYG